MITGHSEFCECFGCAHPTLWPRDTKVPLCAPSPYADCNWGYPWAEKRIPILGCDCQQCAQARANRARPSVDESRSKIAELELDVKFWTEAARKEAAALESTRKESAAHWQRILQQDKAIEELREDRKSILKDYGDALTELNRVIADLRKKLATPSIKITADTEAFQKAISDVHSDLDQRVREFNNTMDFRMGQIKTLRLRIAQCIEANRAWRSKYLEKVGIEAGLRGTVKGLREQLAAKDLAPVKEFVPHNEVRSYYMSDYQTQRLLRFIQTHHVKIKQLLA